MTAILTPAARETTFKPHLSATQLDMFCRCPEMYRRRYIEGEIIPPGIALLKGKGFHVGAETNMRQKIATHDDLPVADIVDAAIAGFDLEASGGFLLNDGESLGRAKDELAEMAQAHAELQAPHYQPVMVEETVRIVLPSAPRDLLGVIDLADDLDRVTDFKTASKRKSQSDADDSVQLTVYAGAFQSKTGKPPTEVRIDAVVKTKTKTDRQVLSSLRDSADFNALANRINSVTAAIAAGSFTPASPGSWWCSPKFCGYWRSCPYVNSERKQLLEISQ